MVSNQSEDQSSSSTPVDSDVPIDPPAPMLKIDDRLSDLSVDIAESCSVDKPPAKKQKIFDAEKIIMGEELSDIEINYAQRLLKEKYLKISGFRTTLYKGKIPEIEECSDCTLFNKHHWITVSTINCKEGEVRVLDSVSLTVTKKLRQSFVVCINVTQKI